MLKESILKDMQVEQAPAGISTEVGSVVPDTTVLRPLPAIVAEKIPSIRTYRFFVKESTIILVDPQDSTVVEVVE